MTTDYTTSPSLKPEVAIDLLQALVKEVAGPSAVFDIPARLLPPTNLNTIDRYFFSNNKEDSKAVPLIQGDIDRFFEKTPIGTYRLGWWGHGINSYALYIQLRSKSSSIFLRLPFGGCYEDNQKRLVQINEYLEVLVGILEQCDKRGIDIEVCESMGFGFYRMFTRDGEGTEFEESLFEHPNPTVRFNKMLAIFAVGISRSDELKIFFNDDHGYRSWLIENPGGYVLNSYKKPSGEYLVLHYSECVTINDELENYTHGDYQKICAPGEQAISDWTTAVTGNEPSRCKTCFK